MTGKYVAKWILLPKTFHLSYRTPPVPLLVFPVQRDEGRELVGKIIRPRKHQRDQNSIGIILEHHSINNVKKFLPWRTNSGCNTHKCCPITVTAEYLFQLFSVDCSGILLALTWSVNNANLSSISCTIARWQTFKLSCTHSKPTHYCGGRVECQQYVILN